MNKAADLFTDILADNWTRTEFEATWEVGSLAEPDEGILRKLCEEHGCDYEQSLQQAMDYVHSQVPQTYTLEMSEECGGSESEDFEADTWREAVSYAKERLQEWVRGGDYGINGASVSANYVLYDEDGEEVDEENMRVEIEPDHDALIREAGGDICCKHDWSAEGEGGCQENPGVWSTGGTSMVFKRHCRKCGLKRTENWTGAQRNPGEHDTFEYEQPENWCEECQSEECGCQVESSLE